MPYGHGRSNYTLEKIYERRNRALLRKSLNQSINRFYSKDSEVPDLASRSSAQRFIILTLFSVEVDTYWKLAPLLLPPTIQSPNQNNNSLTAGPSSDMVLADSRPPPNQPTLILQLDMQNDRNAPTLRPLDPSRPFCPKIIFPCYFLSDKSENTAESEKSTSGLGSDFLVNGPDKANKVPTKNPKKKGKKKDKNYKRLARKSKHSETQPNIKDNNSNNTTSINNRKLSENENPGSSTFSTSRLGEKGVVRGKDVILEEKDHGKGKLYRSSSSENCNADISRWNSDISSDDDEPLSPLVKHELLEVERNCRCLDNRAECSNNTSVNNNTFDQNCRVQCGDEACTSSNGFRPVVSGKRTRAARLRNLRNSNFHGFNSNSSSNSYCFWQQKSIRKVEVEEKIPVPVQPRGRMEPSRRVTVQIKAGKPSKCETIKSFDGCSVNSGGFTSKTVDKRTQSSKSNAKQGSSKPRMGCSLNNNSSNVSNDNNNNNNTNNDCSSNVVLRDSSIVVLKKEDFPLLPSISKNTKQELDEKESGNRSEDQTVNSQVSLSLPLEAVTKEEGSRAFSSSDNMGPTDREDAAVSVSDSFCSESPKESIINDSVPDNGDMYTGESINSITDSDTFNSNNSTTDSMSDSPLASPNPNSSDNMIQKISADLEKIRFAVKSSHEMQIAWEGVQLADFERFLHCASPVVGHTYSSFCEIPRIPLRNLWLWYEEPSCYGMEVGAWDPHMSRPFSAYFVPYLSAVQLLVRKKEMEMKTEMETKTETKSKMLGALPILSLLLPPEHTDRRKRDFTKLPLSGEEEDSEVVFEFFEAEQPPWRRPLFDKVQELISGIKPYNCRISGDPMKLACLNLHDLHPASWYCVAWYPIYRIPDGNFHAAFLTYHSMGHFVCRTDSMNLDGLSSIVSPVVGLQNYNDKGEWWFQSRDIMCPNASEIMKERLSALHQTASVMARAKVLKNGQLCLNHHPDFEFFLSRYR